MNKKTKMISMLVCASACYAFAASPDVFVIDDFSNGIGQWKNNDTATLSWGEGVEGGKCLEWTAKDDGVGDLIFTGWTNTYFRFSDYDLLTFRLKIEGKPIWNIGPIIQQYPAVYGFRALYYSVDTLEPFGEWFQFTQDLKRWENVDAGLNMKGVFEAVYSTTNREFSFNISQLAGAERTKVSITDITLLKNPLGLQPSYPGRWRTLPGGGQAMDFEIELRNTSSNDLTVQLAPISVSGVTNQMTISVELRQLTLPRGQTVVVKAQSFADAKLLASVPPWYGEIFRLAVTVPAIPGLVLSTDLASGTRPIKVEHPTLLCTPEKMRELRKQYADPVLRKQMPQNFIRIVNEGEKTLAYVAEYPPMAAGGLTRDPITGGVLEQIDVPNLPFNVYQDPISGRTFSGMIFDTGVLKWTTQHERNATAAKALGLAYLVTGRREFAEAAAGILRKYTDVYLTLPICAIEPASPVGSRVSGSVRIGTYMQERSWLSNLAVALDCIIPSTLLSEAERQAFTAKVLQPSADNMMDHRVGLMNLQWMIESAALFAGLAGEEPSLVTRSVHDVRGMKRMMELGFCKDGNWWENPSYQTVALLSALPALSAAVHNGIIPWSPRLETILKAPYNLYGPGGRAPILGTGGEADLACANTGVALFSKFIQDPALVGAAYSNRQYAAYGLADYALLRYEDPKVSRDKATSPIPTQTTMLPDYGGAALRFPSTDHYCYFHFGRELIHGHPNKLSINAYGAGGWFARNVTGGYQNNCKDFLFTPASSCTIMVDGGIADADTGECLFYASTKDAEMISAREIGAWKDVEHERTIVMTPGPLIVLDRCLSDKTHTYDWLHHTGGTKLDLVKTGDFKASPEPLGNSPRYSSLDPVGILEKFKRVSWTRQDGSGLAQTFVDDGTLHVVNIKQTLATPHDSLVWRKTGKTVGFAMAFLPYAKGEAHDLSVQMEKALDAHGRIVPIEKGQAVSVRSGTREWLVLVNYSGELLQTGLLSSTNRVSVLCK